jgi:hypothetical protein
MSKPIFVCIPGVSHPPIIYDPLKASLSLHGYTAILVPLPSIGASQPVYDFTDDVLAIRLAISRLVDAGTDVIVVIHGWSGVVGGEALQGMSKTERARRGLRGGVVRLVFIMAWIVKEGFQGAPRGDVSSMLPYLQADTLVSHPSCSTSLPHFPQLLELKIFLSPAEACPDISFSLLRRYPAIESRTLGRTSPMHTVGGFSQEQEWPMLPVCRPSTMIPDNRLSPSAESSATNIYSLRCKSILLDYLLTCLAEPDCRTHSISRRAMFVQRHGSSASQLLDITTSSAEPGCVLEQDDVCSMAAYSNYVRPLRTGPECDSGVCRDDDSSGERLRGTYD